MNTEKKPSAYIIGLVGAILLILLFLLTPSPIRESIPSSVMNSEKSPSKFLAPALHLKSGDVSLIVVDTPQAREQGLSGKDSLPDNTAMLFVFDIPDIYGFWMKDMKFPIDIIWIDADHHIVSMQRSLSPNTFPKVFYPSANSLYVLETVAGFAEKNNLKVGDTLNF